MAIDSRQLSAVHALFRGRQNVVVSNLLREHGYKYKVAFGCSLPDIKSVARMLAEGAVEGLQSGAELAEALWADDSIRESKLCAPMLYPRGEMSVETAVRWSLSIPTPEVADVVCMYAFQFGIGHQLIELWSKSEQPMQVYCARSLAKRLNDE